MRPAKRQRVVAALEARDGPDCWYCGCEFGSGKRLRTLDHVRPVAEGGARHLDNLRLACTKCNRRKATVELEAFLASAWLAQRRLTMSHLAAAEVRRSCQHVELVWRGEMQWSCSSCRRSGRMPDETPARIPCREVAEELDVSYA